MSDTKYYCKCFFSNVSYFFSASLKLREAYAIGLSLPFLPCDNIPPIAYPEASVVRIKGWEKSGRYKSGSSHNIEKFFLHDF